MAGIGPQWWHHHGTKMRGEYNPADGTVTITGSAAKLFIYPKSQQGSSKMWVVCWIVIFSFDSKVEGKLSFTTEQLCAAFGVETEKPFEAHFGQWLIDRYGADYAEQGKFIRQGDYLNIPGPGTSNDGDPNVSVMLDDDITKAIKDLVERQD